MIDQSKYWERVEEAARKCVVRPGLDQRLEAYSHAVLLSDLRERVLEMEEKQNERSG